nr:MAG TPA: Major capsid protein [Microviridae sp.]
MANRSNVMGLHGLKNKPSRNSFDVSARNLFTAKIGELLPCAVYEMNPGDSIRIDASYFTRTAPLQTAAFTRLRENVQFFFVPYSQLWKYFNTQVLNMNSSASGKDVSRIATSPFSNEKVTTGMPYVSYFALHKYLFGMGQAAKAQLGDPFQDKFPNSVFDNNGELRWAASSKLLQLLGYGRFDYQNMTPPHFDDVSVSGMSHLPNVSIFRLLAYQKICNDHYQFRQWQGYDASLCNVDYVKPSGSMDLSPQLDQINFSTGANADRLNFLDLRFSNLPLDYLNGVLPTAQFGSESVVSLSGSSASGDIVLNNLQISDPSTAVTSDVTVLRTKHAIANVDGSGVVSADQGYNFLGAVNSDTVRFTNTGMRVSSLKGTTSSDPSTLGPSLSIAALRQAYAAQKYKEIQLANDVDFASQIEAHFGVKPKHADDVSYFIGGSSSMIDINPIVNQNLSGDLQANYKASPIGSGSSKIKFTADTYGVVMGIYRCTPVLDYAHIGIDRTLCKTDASDFVIPEMDSIGMQQNYLFEVQAPSFNSVIHAFTDDENFAKSYGYAPRYAEYKTNFDKYNGDFCFTLDSWVTGLPANMIDEICRHNLSSMQIAPELFNCRPSLCNSIFVNQDNYLVSDDKLYVGMVNMAYVTRNLSRYGLPYSN